MSFEDRNIYGSEEILIGLLEDDVIIPTRKHTKDAGIDLYSLNRIRIAKGIPTIVRTGICVEIPDGCVGIIKPKSRTDFIIGGGVVDEGYTGEILVKVLQTFCEEYLIEAGEPIAQLLVIPVVTPRVRIVAPETIQSKKTARGGTGGIVSQLALDLE